MRQKIVAGNWKMNKSLNEAMALTKEIQDTADLEKTTRIILCPPALYLQSMQEQLGITSLIKVGAQNCSSHESGAYTGEISAAMLQSLHTNYVILGHSERRQFFNEQSDELAKKVDQVLKHDMVPIFCCGEMLDVRERGAHEGLIRKQTQESLFHLSGETIGKIVIAYEPVWAIGTGKTATSEQAQTMHAVIRQHLEAKYGKSVSDQIPILYGGSVKPENAKEIFSCPDVDGGLIGGASLKAQDFLAIVNAA